MTPQTIIKGILFGIPFMIFTFGAMIALMSLQWGITIALHDMVVLLRTNLLQQVCFISLWIAFTIVGIIIFDEIEETKVTS